MHEITTVGGRRPVTAAAGTTMAIGSRAASVLMTVAMAAYLAVGLAACSPSPRSPEDRARDVAEQWVAASNSGDDDAAFAVGCGGDPRLGVNADSGGFESYTLDVEPVGDGDFNITVTASYPDYPDLVSNLRVRTEGDTCVEWVR